MCFVREPICKVREREREINTSRYKTNYQTYLIKRESFVDNNLVFII